MAQDTDLNSLGLNSLAPARGSRHRKKRLGIGEGSGSGKTSGRGTKGYGARSGWKQKPGFEGGQMPLHRRLPKYGFTSRKRVLGVNTFTPVNLDRLLSVIGSDNITLQAMLEAGITRTAGERVKILSGKLSGTKLGKVVSVEAHAFSASARSSIEEAGGKVVVVSE